MIVHLKLLLKAQLVSNLVLVQKYLTDIVKLKHWAVELLYLYFENMYTHVHIDNE